MQFRVSSDEYGPLVLCVIKYLEKRGIEVEYYGPVKGEKACEDHDWPLVTARAAGAVSRGEADGAVTICWTGTGACLAANKQHGVRAALCNDATTASGARKWNHANVLALSLRSVTPALAEEILDAWFATDYERDDWNKLQIERIKKMDDGREKEENRR